MLPRLGTWPGLRPWRVPGHARRLESASRTHCSRVFCCGLDGLQGSALPSRSASSRRADFVETSPLRRALFPIVGTGGCRGGRFRFVPRRNDGQHDAASVDLVATCSEPPRGPRSAKPYGRNWVVGIDVSASALQLFRPALSFRQARFSRTHFASLRSRSDSG